MGDWGKHTSEICRTAFSRMGMLSKLKYVGVPIEDPIEIYCLFIRSTAEYCSAVFTTSLTCEQERKHTNIEKTALKIKLHDNYISYEAALEMTGITSLSERAPRLSPAQLLPARLPTPDARAPYVTTFRKTMTSGTERNSK